MSSLYTSLRKEYPRTWRIWYRMNKRCEGTQEKSYIDVHVCNEWNKDTSTEIGFINFIDDMGPSEENLSIDRINPFGGYEPGNCRWTTRLVQNNNTRFSTTERGKMMRLAAKNGINRHTFYGRVKRGWALIDAATLPPSDEKYKSRII